MDAYVALAKYGIESYVRNGKRASLYKGIPEEFLTNKAGVFVSLKKDGKLRGCIGTISPVKENIGEEILENGVSAATRDPRFEPVREEELDQLEYSVDVLFPPEPIDSKALLDVKEYGVIVTSGNRRGLLLPNLEGVETVQQQVFIALSKAGIRQGEPFQMERFKVIRHEESM